MKYAGVFALILLFAASAVVPVAAQYRTDSAVDLLLNRVFGDDERMSRLPTVIRGEGVGDDRQERVDDRSNRVDDRARGTAAREATDRSDRSETGARSETGSRSETGGRSETDASSETGAPTDRGDRTRTADRSDRDARATEARRTERRETARSTRRDRTDRTERTRRNDSREGQIIIGRRDRDGDRRRDRDHDHERDRRYEKGSENAKRGKGPAFCRSGAGHPVHGRQWCRDKGFGLGNDGPFYDDRRIYDERRDDRRRDEDRRRRGSDRTILDDILGRLNE